MNVTEKLGSEYVLVSETIEQVNRIDVTLCHGVW